MQHLILTLLTAEKQLDTYSSRYFCLTNTRRSLHTVNYTSLHIALPDTDYYHILTIISQVVDLDGLNMCRGSVCVILWVISAGVMTFC